MTKFRIFELSAPFKSGLTSSYLAREVFQKRTFQGPTREHVACWLTATGVSLRLLHGPVPLRSACEGG